MRVDIEYYDVKHRQALKDRSFAFNKMEELITSGLEFTKWELFSMCIFKHQQLNNIGHKTYRELQNHIVTFCKSWEYYFDFTGNTIISRYPSSDVDTSITETIGDGCGLLIANQIYNLVEPDWEKIPTSNKIGTLDFGIASTGQSFIEIETKGSVIEQNAKTSKISNHKTSIEVKKDDQRKNDNNHELIGIISAFPTNQNLTAKAYLLDPPAVNIPYDPFKYKLLARLYYYWQELRMISRAHFIEILINRIKTIQMLEDYRSIDKLPILNRNGEPHGIPASLFESRSYTKDMNFFGEVIPLTTKRDEFIFYGYRREVIDALLKQSFEDICSIKFDTEHLNEVPVLAKIPKFISTDTTPRINESEDDEDKNRKLVPMLGDLHCLSSGKIIGIVRPSD
ncbi:MAG: hypothetical protein A2Y40_10225 [Candidatus Margulisbacteria bacterium GWF2_35_9]|nr:MAG: hypothetical protein A2Y40_10225 [Candidatus Margulisbacteria bacterium GWF2_35_9]